MKIFLHIRTVLHNAFFRNSVGSSIRNSMNTSLTARQHAHLRFGIHNNGDHRLCTGLAANNRSMHANRHSKWNTRTDTHIPAVRSTHSSAARCRLTQHNWLAVVLSISNAFASAGPDLDKSERAMNGNGMLANRWCAAGHIIELPNSHATCWSVVEHRRAA